MGKNSKTLKLLLGMLALGICSCERKPVTVTDLSGDSKTKEDVDPIEQDGFNPITKAIKDLAASKTPALDPAAVVFSKQDSYDYESQAYKAIDLQSIDVANRTGRTLIYLFEGKYTEGYQGEYFIYYANIYLWDDGFLTGKSHNEVFKGYWYNDEDGDGKVTDTDKLCMVCDPVEFEKYHTIVCDSMEYNKDWIAYLYMNIADSFQRSILVNGYMYYEPIAIAIDTSKTGTEFHKGDPFDIRQWAVVQINQNLKYRYVFERIDKENMEVKWTIPDGLIVNEALSKEGTFEIKASFNNFEASATITVK